MDVLIACGEGVLMGLSELGPVLSLEVHSDHYKVRIGLMKTSKEVDGLELASKDPDSAGEGGYGKKGEDKEFDNHDI